MGWTGSNMSRSERVAEILGGGGTWKLLASKMVGNCLWSVWDTPKNGNVILLHLFERRGGMTLDKGMDESMGPFYYSCPLKFLEMAPCLNQWWRTKVRKFHEDRKNRKPLRTGQKIRFTETSYGGEKEFEVIVEGRKTLFRKSSGTVTRLLGWRKQVFEVVQPEVVQNPA